MIVLRNLQVHALWAAARDGDLVSVKKAVSHTEDLDVKYGPNGDTPLTVAVVNGHQAVVVELLNSGADVNVKDRLGNTPLSLASGWGGSGYPRFRIMRSLIQAGADVDATNVDGDTPLHVASRAGYDVAVQLLVFHGADVNMRAHDGATALLLASAGGHADVVYTLLLAGADPSQGDDSGEAPLHVVSSTVGESSTEIVEALMMAGANVNATTNSGDSPLHYAAFFGNAGVLKVLLEHGAVVTAGESFHRSPLGVVCGCRINEGNPALRQCPVDGCDKPSIQRKVRRMLLKAGVAG